MNGDAEDKRKALQNGSEKKMHEWRKRVKYQRDHLEMLRKIRKEEMEQMAQQAHRLADLLGQYNDLAVLEKLAVGELRSALEKKHRRMLLSLIAKRQQMLQKKAAKLGRRLCAENGGEFVSRIHRYWQAWC